MLRARVHVTSPTLVLSHTRRAVPDMRFEVTYQAVSEVVFVTVEGEGFDRLERALEEDETVSAFERQTDYGDQRSYKLTVDVDRPVISEVAAEHGISVIQTTSEPGDTGWTFELLSPDRNALTALREFCVENDLEFGVDRLFYSEGGDELSDEYGLTRKQRETLVTAYDLGYFEIPRAVSQQELAERLDSSPTAVSQRIRRGVTGLIANTVAPARDGDGRGEE